MSINTNYTTGIKTNGSYQFKNSSDYSKYLSNKYKCLTPCKNASVSIDSSVLRKASSNKKTAEWLEENLSIMPDIFKKAQMSAAARGSKLVSAEFRFTNEGTEMITCTVSGESDTDTGIDKWLEEIGKDRQDTKKHRTDSLDISAKAMDILKTLAAEKKDTVKSN